MFDKFMIPKPCACEFESLVVRDACGLGVIGKDGSEEGGCDDVAVFVGSVEFAFGPLESKAASNHEKFFR